MSTPYEAADTARVAFDVLAYGKSDPYARPGHRWVVVDVEDTVEAIDGSRDREITIKLTEVPK